MIVSRCEIDIVGIRDTSSEELLEDAPDDGVCAGSKDDHFEWVSLLTSGLALDFVDIAVGVGSGCVSGIPPNLFPFFCLFNASGAQRAAGEAKWPISLDWH